MLTVPSITTVFRVLAVAAALSFAGVGQALAVTAPEGSAARSGLTISPTQKELVISSGLIHASTEVVLTNHTGKNLEASIRLVDFKTLNETSGLLFGAAGIPSEKYGLANWMSLPNGNKVTLLNNQATRVPVDVVNRFDLTPGGHYGAVVVTVSTAGAATSNQASFKQELVSLLFVKKRGGEDYGLLLQSFSATPKNNLPSAVSMRFRATGNVHVVPRGYVTVTDPKGKLVAKGIINPESAMVLPGTSRQFSTELPPISGSRYFGKYKITAYYRHDEQATFSTATVYSTVLPPPYTLILLVALTGVIVVVATRAKRRIHAKLVQTDRK